MNLACVSSIVPAGWICHNHGGLLDLSLINVLPLCLRRLANFQQHQLQQVRLNLPRVLEYNNNNLMSQIDTLHAADQSSIPLRRTGKQHVDGQFEGAAEQTIGRACCWIGRGWGSREPRDCSLELMSSNLSLGSSACNKPK